MFDRNPEVRAEAASLLADLRLALPSHLQARLLSPKAKIPFKAALFRDSLLWRIEELGRSSLEAYDRADHIAALLLVRGVIETVAALGYLHQLVTGYEGGNPEELDSTLMRLLLGSKSRTDRPNPINVMTLLEKMGKNYPAVPAIYDTLSEYAHPNDEGTSQAYAELDPKGQEARFGRGYWPARRAFLVLEALATTLMLVLPLSDELFRYFPAFVAHCERDIEQGLVG